MSYTVAVSGASGYAGGEVLRLLAAHPDIEIRTVTANSNAGQPLVAHQPHLRSLAHLTLQPTTPEVLAGHDIVVLALPHGQSGQYTDALADTPLVIDAGADHRLTSATAWDSFYGGDFHDAWTYGVPELPVAGVSVLAVGPSGAGKSLKTNLLGSEILGTANPYAVGGTHRHIPEIRQALEGAGARGEVRISFTPVIVPMARGILATTSAPIAAGASDADIRAAWQDAYGDETFVQLLPAGEFPRTADVLGANTALLGLAIDRPANRVVIVAAVDNLVKGTAGAAVQSMNIALGLPEDRALTVNGVAP
ncbi:MAG: N-acetyl-gamma-glutamyl-phosphate reductase [Microbacterium sp.]|nr:N-acetyl-gamma-glutamyl-phosphate reductase [Microbacterium sp.]